MRQSLIVTDALRDLIGHLPPALKKKIRTAFDEIVKNPSSGKALVEELQGLQSYKIGGIRIIYRIEGSSVALIAVGPHKTIYQKVALELKKK